MILVVDDELIIQQMIASVIEDAGHHALTAGDGRAALALLDAVREPPALVITDLMMPRMNGVALTQALKLSRRFHGVPVVLMSAACHANRANMADHFLPKPFALDDIEALLEQYADQSVPRPLDMPDLPHRQPEYQRAVGD
jgi:CheY-like chemotaxis protein